MLYFTSYLEYFILKVEYSFYEFQAVTDIFSPRHKVNEDEVYLWISLVSLCSGLLLSFIMGIVLRKVT